MPPDTPNSAPPLHDPSCLLEHVGWVRELAQRLVRDPHAADDLTQETMLAAIENRGEPTRSPRAWLGRVLRNVLWEGVRQGRRRQAREQAVARTDSSASSAELVEKVDTHRTMVDAVMRLPEHYRTVLLRRYFEGETPTQIAAALEMPIATVKTRLQRGLERMRSELDQAYGDRERWQPALVLLIGVPRRAVLVPLPLAVAISLLLAISAVAAWSVFGDPTVAPQPPNSTAKSTASTETGSTPEPLAAAIREDATAHQATVVDWGAVKMPKQPVRGITVTPDGQPIGGVLLQFAPDRPQSGGGRGTTIVISGHDGSFEMMLARSGRIAAVPGDLATLCAGVFTPSGTPNLRVVVTAAKPFAGRIVDEQGNGLAHARILMSEPPAMRSLLGDAANSSAMALHTATSKADGTFAFEPLPLAPGACITVRREGYVAQEIAWHGEHRLDLTMKAPTANEHEVSGFVYTPNGRPVHDARVACGTVVTRSDRTGAFRLPLPQLPTQAKSATLLATAPGFGAAVATTTTIDEQCHPQWPNGVAMRLREASLSVSGQVLRADGSPAIGARVWLADPTMFSHHEGQSQSTSVCTDRDDVMRDFWPETIESMQSADGRLDYVKADAEGKFTIEGLCPRDYRLVAYDFVTQLRSAPTRVTAGADKVTVQLQGDVIVKVEGRVVDQHDEPIAGVSVALSASLLGLHWGSNQVFGKRHISGSMRTGPDGSFWLFHVPSTGVRMHFDGAGIVAMTKEPNAGPMRIVAHRQVLLSVSCADIAAVDSLGAIDRDGAPVLLTRFRGNGSLQSHRVKLHNGRAESFALPDEAVTIIGYLGNKEHRRTPMQPKLRTITW